MSSRDNKVLKNILKHIEHTLRYVERFETLEQFSQSYLEVEACVFNLMQIGELAHAELSEECKISISAIPWNEIYGMRNRIVHGYGELRMDIVWEVIKDDLPLLKAEVERYINQTEKTV